jgi:hypothetical protein
MMLAQAIEMQNELAKKYCNKEYFKISLEHFNNESKSNNVKISEIIMYIIDIICKETEESISKGLLLNIKTAKLTDIQNNRIINISKTADDYFGGVIVTGAGVAYSLGGVIGAVIGANYAASRNNEEDAINKFTSTLNNCIKAYTDCLFENNYMYM